MSGQESRLKSVRQRAPGGWWLVGVLTLVNVLAVVDRTLPAVLIEQIKRDLALTDSQFGLINGLVFTAVYCLAAPPLSGLADRGSRRLIIAGSLVFWSVMTMAGSASRRFAELALARVGLAVGEGGFLPAAQSMITDRIDARHRGLALSLLMAGSSIGVTIGLTAGGFLGGLVGWRRTMLLVGACGLPLSLIMFLAVREPPRSEPQSKRETNFLSTLALLIRLPSFRHIALGGALYSAFSSAAAAFTPGFLIRSFGLGMESAGTAFGLVFGVAGILGIVLGGFLGDRLGVRDPRWIVWVPAIGLAVSGPAAVAGYLAGSSSLSLLLLFIPKALGPMFLGTCYGLVHRMVTTDRRATSSAVLLIAIQGVGASLGPWLAGTLSDTWAGALDRESLRYALAAVSVALAWASIHFLLAGRTLTQDMLPVHP